MEYQNLTGEYRHRVDAQGRVAIPSCFRDSFIDGVIAARGIDKCVDLFSQSNWVTHAKQVTDLPITIEKARRYRRLTMSGTFNLETDKQGRILIPASLRTYADLEEEVTVAGVGDHLELWDTHSWDIELESILAHRKYLAESIEDTNR